MFGLLNRLTIVQTTVSSIVVFALTLIVLVSLSVISTLKDYQQQSHNLELLEIMQALEKIAHNHAVERGMTAGYLGAPNSDKMTALNGQRRKADASVEDLNRLFRGDGATDLQAIAHINRLTNYVKSKAQIRASVNQQSAPDAFSYYSQLNKYALDTLQIMRSEISGQASQQNIGNVLFLSWFKERAGQARGVINGVLARRNIQGETKATVSIFINEMQSVTEYLYDLLDGKQKQDFERVIASANSQQIRAIHTQILASQNTLAETLPTAGVWFPLATKQIGEVKGILEHQWQVSFDHAQTDKDNAYQALLWQVVILAIVLVVVGVLNTHLLRSLKSKLEVLTKKLRNVADNGDLTLDVRLESEDELGDISKAIHATIYAFKDLVVGLATSIKTSSQLSGELNQVTSVVVNDAESTQQMAHNISSAVEEMSMTSGEIASSAASTLEASDKLSSDAGRSIEVNQQTSEAMETLSKSMSEVELKAGNMEEQVNAITGILETINSLAEQTNLLALNAAIEAARAGEAGRGFAVVADEVRNLAKGSKQSSDKISNLLDDLQSASNQVVSAIKDNASSAQKTLTRTEQAKVISIELREQSKVVEDLSMQVATAAEQQSVTAKEISADASEVLKAATDELEAAKKMKVIFSNMEANGKILQGTMDHFKIE